MQFNLTRAQIRAMLNLAATKDVRYYLNGLHIVQDARGTIVEATDGHLLGMMLVDSAPQPIGNVILDRDSLKGLIGTKRDSHHVVEFTVNDGHVTASCMGTVVTFKAVDGVFPDTRRVTPTANALAASPDDTLAQFNPELLIRFTDCAKDLGYPKAIPALRHRGASSALVDLGLENFIGVVMPVRDSGFTIIPPAWVHASREPEAAPVADPATPDPVEA